MIKTKKQMFLIIASFVLVILLCTTTYAFFNYTRTGTANIIKTGRIYFNSEQGTAINLENLFPIDPTETGIMNDATKVGTVTINVKGDTTYSDGIEYLVSAVNVQNSVGNKSLPISIDVSYSANGNGKVIGTEDEEYFDNRGGNTSIYKVLANNTISNNGELVVGYIARGATGIDGNIVIKAYIDRNKVAISDTYPEGDVTHTEGEEPNQTTVTDYTNGTTSTWVGDRTVFTTTEWNSLQTNGVSFQVKVEANEGTWVEETRTINTMNTFPTVITNEKTNIREVYFNKMGATRMQQSYDAATIKVDLTVNNEGKVLAWLEENQLDNTKYNLIIASDGNTFLTTGQNLFEGWTGMQKIEFNNIDTSRVTNMSNMFVGCVSLVNIDLTSFNTANVTTMEQMFYYCSNLVSVDLSGLDTSNITNMVSMFCSSGIETIDLSGLGSDNLTTIYLMFSGCKNLREINLSEFNFGTASLADLFAGCLNLETADLSDSNTENVINMERLFNGCTKLTNVDLSGIDISNVTNMEGMFAGSGITTIYVSNTWDTSSVTNSYTMFIGCTSLVGQAPSKTYAFDSNDATDKTYARIATDNQKGYLTLKTN